MSRAFKDCNLSDPAFHLNIGLASKTVLTLVLRFWEAERQKSGELMGFDLLLINEKVRIYLLLLYCSQK